MKEFINFKNSHHINTSYKFDPCSCLCLHKHYHILLHLCESSPIPIHVWLPITSSWKGVLKGSSFHQWATQGARSYQAVVGSHRLSFVCSFEFPPRVSCYSSIVNYPQALSLCSIIVIVRKFQMRINERKVPKKWVWNLTTPFIFSLLDLSS